MNPTDILTATLAIIFSLTLARAMGCSVWISWLAALTVGILGHTGYSQALLILGLAGALLEYFTSRHVEPR